MLTPPVSARAWSDSRKVRSATRVNYVTPFCWNSGFGIAMPEVRWSSEFLGCGSKGIVKALQGTMERVRWKGSWTVLVSLFPHRGAVREWPCCLRRRKQHFWRIIRYPKGSGDRRLPGRRAFNKVSEIATGSLKGDSADRCL
jgi:hypothetical protein